jgi:hypothetical protein
MTHPRGASRLPLKGASSADWQSQIGDACLQENMSDANWSH